MMRFPPLNELRGHVLVSAGGVAAAVVLLTTFVLWGAQNRTPHDRGVLSPPSAIKNQAALLAPKQKDDPKKSKLEMTKADAAELSALADQLRDELNKMNVYVLPLDVIQKTEKVEKLAKKIRGEVHE